MRPKESLKTKSRKDTLLEQFRRAMEGFIKEENIERNKATLISLLTLHRKEEFDHHTFLTLVIENYDDIIANVDDRYKYKVDDLSTQYIADKYLADIIGLIPQYFNDVFRQIALGETPFSLAAKNGMVNVVDILIKQKHADIGEKDKKYTIITWVLENCGVDVIAAVIDAVPDKTILHRADANGYKPLLLAAKMGMSSTVQTLLHTDMFSIDEKYEAVRIAAAHGQIKIIELLLDSGEIDINNWKDDDSILTWAIRNHVDATSLQSIITVLKKKHQSQLINKQDNYKNTPLFLALKLNSEPEVIETLLDAGADVNLRVNQGQSLLEYVLDFGRKDLLILLLTKAKGHVDVNRVEVGGAKLLTWAVAKQNFDNNLDALKFIKALLEKGADIDDDNLRAIKDRAFKYAQLQEIFWAAVVGGNSNTLRTIVTRLNISSRVQSEVYSKASQEVHESENIDQAARYLNSMKVLRPRVEQYRKYLRIIPWFTKQGLSDCSKEYEAAFKRFTIKILEKGLSIVSEETLAEINRMDDAEYQGNLLFAAIRGGNLDMVKKFYKNVSNDVQLQAVGLADRLREKEEEVSDPVQRHSGVARFLGLKIKGRATLSQHR